MRCRFLIGGAVQGVGFRPFVYRLAIEYQLSGWVKNNPAGVIIEVEGDSGRIAAFEKALQDQKPPNAIIDFFESEPLGPQNDTDFKIIPSDESDEFSASILPDLAVCADCLREMNDPSDRRYRYPFINCTNCGPRYTIMTALPYDRPHTSMAKFEMCAACRAEYEDPLNRRFHAQPVACPDCGPHISLWDKKGAVLAAQDDALAQVVAAVRGGKIVALKGLGGFHLICDAKNEKAIELLRARKHRKTKPFAVMYPSLEAVRQDCLISKEEEHLLCSAAAPIVLLKSRKNYEGVAPGNPYLGVMLPYTPLHYLLLKELDGPVVATSGNRISEPICTDEQEARERLEGIADLFLVHNRPIINRSDDSIVRVMAERETVLRRGRGYAPLPVMMKNEAEQAILAVGAHLKNTVAFAKGHRMVLGPHIGDLDTPEACAAHEQSAAALIDLYREEPGMVAHDAHPDYRSTQMAHRRDGDSVAVQHHYAHALSCMLDNNIEVPCFAVVWDGTGYGDDGTIWGGEFLSITEEGYERAAHFLPFPLPGGEAAIRDPRRAAYGALYIMGEEAPESDVSPIWQAMEKGINAPMTSSAGRLFDAVAALTCLGTENSFEGEAAMAVEFAAMKSEFNEHYDFEIRGRIIDWRPMIKQIMREPGPDTARKFHNTLAEIIVAVAQGQKERRILLTGGCFQNRLLLETTVKRLREAGFEPFWHRRIPPNDGGLAAGQVLAAIREGQ